MSHACDICALRKIKCDARSPCASCIASSFTCTRLRKRFKSGPKGPRKKTRQAILQIQKTSRDTSRLDHASTTVAEAGASSLSATHSLTGYRHAHNRESVGPECYQTGPIFSSPIALSSFRTCLTVFHRRLYVVWPVVNHELLLDRLRNPDDHAAYSLATAVCAATIAQLHVPVDDNIHGAFPVHHYAMAIESERARTLHDCVDYPTVETLLTSFFLHVYYTNTGKLWKSTLFLREAIAYAHILGLHKDAHYEGLEPASTQHHLRIAWILFITDAAHSLQHDVPATFKLSSTLPALESEECPSLLPAFCCLCKLFQSYDESGPGNLAAKQTTALEAIRSRLCQSHSLPSCSNIVQQADILVTEPWLRIVLWKRVIPYVDLTVEPTGHCFSITFPIAVAKDLLSRMSTLTLDALEAHGPGMRSKLFEVASSLADVIACLPRLTAVSSLETESRDVLRRLANSIVSLKVTDDPALMALLQEKMTVCGLQYPGASRITDITEDVTHDKIGEAENSGDSSPGASTRVRHDACTSPMLGLSHDRYDDVDSFLETSNPSIPEEIWSSDPLWTPISSTTFPCGEASGEEGIYTGCGTPTQANDDLSTPVMWISDLSQGLIGQDVNSLPNSYL